MTNTLKLRLLATTIVAGVAAVANPALAQNANQPGQTPTAPTVGGSSTAALPSGQQGTAEADTENAPGKDIVVTGSRIANPNATSASPLTAISAQEVRLQGTTRTEDLLNSLPQVFSGQGGNLSNGASGTATVDLRGLGANRTLVLLNGRRLQPGDPNSSAADLNFVPATLIDRVEVLTGGASSTYGSDAISGVVNFVLNTKFEGVRLDAQYSLFDHSNNNRTAQGVFANPAAGRGFPFPDGHIDVGGTRNVTAVFGAGSQDGRGHIVAYAGYRQIDAVTEGNYDYSSCSLAESASNGLGFACSGSGTTSPARFILNGGAGAQRTIDPATGNTFRPYVAARDSFNFAPYNYYQRPDTRYTAGVFANYELSEHFNPYLEFMFMDDRTVAQIAPSGVFGQIIDLNCNNPLLSASQTTEICGANAGSATATGAVSIGKRNVEGGGRQNDLRHTDYRYVLGLKGAIDSAFSYDAYGQFGRVIYAENYQNDFSVARTRQALNVVNIGGVPSCADATARSQGCVPYNIFQLNGVTPAALAYLQTPGFQQGQVDEYIADASVTGDLGKYGFTSPLASSGVGVAFGTEYRKETLQLLTDAEFSSGDLAGQGGPTKSVSGKFSVYEFFGEVRAPLIENKPFFDSLVVTGGYRYSHYSTAGSTNTYKGGVEYQPINPIRFRASYNRAVRAPNIQELFAPLGQSLFTGSDPCAGAAVAGTDGVLRIGGDPAKNTGATAGQCARTGVTGAQFGNIIANGANQYTQFSGGNANLTPEVSDTYSVGVVLQPGGFLKGLVISADYYNIKVNNTISTRGAQISLNQCLASGDPTFCSLIQRDSTNGSLYLGTVGQVVNTNVNVGRLQTRGIDVAGSYRFEFDRVGLASLGSLGLDYTATFLDKLVAGPGVIRADGTSTFNCAGLYGTICSAANGNLGFAPAPKFRSKLRATVNAPGNVQFSVNWRHLSGVNVDASSTNGFLNSPGIVFASDRRLPAFDYIDLAVAIRVADKFAFRVGANNLFDRDPPLVGSNNLSGTIGNGNTYPQVWDAQGRYLFAGFTVDF